MSPRIKAPRAKNPANWPGWGSGINTGFGGGVVAPPFGPPRVARAPVRPSSPRWPGGCNMPLSALSEAYEYLVIGRADPFALRWIPVLDFITDPITGLQVQVGEIFPLGRTTPTPGVASAIHPGDGGARTADVHHWHHISIGVKGEAIYPVEDPPANIDREAESHGNRSTLLKARVILMMGNSRTRQFDIDVGSGVEIDVKCRAVVGVIALVPDPTSIPPGEPSDLTDPIREFAVALVATVSTCEAAKSHRVQAKYTQSFFIDPTATPPQTTAVMPIMPDAQEIEIYSDDVIAGAGSVVGQFIYGLENRIDASYTPPTASVPLGLLQSLPAQGHVPVATIPGDANAILLTRGAADDNSIITVVQILNV